MKYNEWLDTFIGEKGIDSEEYFELKNSKGTSHSMPYGVVIEHIKIATSEEKKQIKNIMVKIDFHHGDVKLFFRYLAQAIIDN